MAPRIYLFEDDDGLRDVLVELLGEELDADIQACRTMAELQEQCRIQAPDLIVADFWGSSHLTLADSERSSISDLAAIAPVVLVSARNWMLNESAADLGVAALIPKPLDVSGFLEVLRSALEIQGETALKLPPRESLSLFVLGWP